MTALRKASPAKSGEIADRRAAAAKTLALAGDDSAPGINAVADHTERLQAAFGAQPDITPYPGVVRVAIIGGGSLLLWGAIALLVRSLLVH
jgi:hypothetical protein